MRYINLHFTYLLQLLLCICALPGKDVLKMTYTVSGRVYSLTHSRTFYVTPSVIGVESVMRLADRPPPGVVMSVFSRSYLSNCRAIGMVVVRRPSVIRRSGMYCG